STASLIIARSPLRSRLTEGDSRANRAGRPRSVQWARFHAAGQPVENGDGESRLGLLVLAERLISPPLATFDSGPLGRSFRRDCQDGVLPGIVLHLEIGRARRPGPRRSAAPPGRLMG